MRKRIGAAVALWAVGAASTSQAAVEAKACLTDAEAQAVFIAIAPEAIKAVAQKCAPSLPTTATLTGGLATFVSPYEAAAEAAWPLAGPAIAKMAGSLPKGIDPAAMRPMLGPMVGAMAADSVKPKDCTTIDHAVTLLAPLPPANVAGLIVLAAGNASGKGGKAPFSICPAPVVVTVPIPK